MKRISKDDPDIVDGIVEDIMEDYPESPEEPLTIAALLGLHTDVDIRIRKGPGGKVILQSRQEVDLVGLASNLLNLHKKRKGDK